MLSSKCWEGVGGGGSAAGRVVGNDRMVLGGGGEEHEPDTSTGKTPLSTVPFISWFGMSPQTNPNSLPVTPSSHHASSTQCRSVSPGDISVS